MKNIEQKMKSLVVIDVLSIAARTKFHARAVGNPRTPNNCKEICKRRKTKIPQKLVVLVVGNQRRKWKNG